MQSTATTPEAYLAELPPEKRALAEALRALVLEHLPDGYVEAMNWGHICYEVPLERSGKTYNGKPLMYAAIGAQKNHVGLYLCGVYADPARLDRFRARYRDAGLRLDMGKACIRLKKPSGIEPTAIAEAIAALSVDDFIAVSRR